MKTQQWGTPNPGSDELTEELGGFCNKPINSVRLKYLLIPHSQGQLHFCLTFSTASYACLEAGVRVFTERWKGQRCGLQKDGALALSLTSQKGAWQHPLRSKPQLP